MRSTPWALLALLSSFTVQASAGEPPPAASKPERPAEPAGPRLVLSNLFAFRENPLGIEDQLRIGVARLEIHPLASGAEARAEPPR